MPPKKWQLIVGIIGVAGLLVGGLALPLTVYGLGPLGKDSVFGAETFQCCYKGHQMCRTFPRPEALRSMPIRYNLPVNKTWLATGKSLSSSDALELTMLHSEADSVIQ